MPTNDKDVVSENLTHNGGLDSGAILTLVTVDEVAATVRVGRRAVLAAIQRGDLLASDIGTGNARPTWRIRPADVDAWLASRQRHPAARVDLTA